MSLRDAYEGEVLPEGTPPDVRRLVTALETIRYAMQTLSPAGNPVHTNAVRHWLNRKLACIYPNYQELVTALLDESGPYNVLQSGEVLDLGNGRLAQAPGRLVALSSNHVALISCVPTRQLLGSGIKLQVRGPGRFATVGNPQLADLPTQSERDYLGFDMQDLNADQLLTKLLNEGRFGSPGQGSTYYAGAGTAPNLRWGNLPRTYLFHGARLALLRTAQNQYCVEIEQSAVKRYADIAPIDRKRTQIALDRLSPHPAKFHVTHEAGQALFRPRFEVPNQLMRALRLHGAAYDPTTKAYMLDDDGLQLATSISTAMGATKE